MVANGIGYTPGPSISVAGAEVPEGGDGPVGSGDGPGDGLGSGGVPGSVYVDSMAGTVGGSGTYDLSHPQLAGLAPDHPVNVALRRPTEAVRAEFVSVITDRTGEESGTGAEAVSPDSLSGSGMVLLSDDRVVSVVYEFRIEWAGAAGPDDRVDSMLVDLGTGTEVGLGDLFMADSPWMETVGFLARQELAARLGEAGLWPDGRGLGPEASNYAVFGLTTDDLVLRFASHQVAPGVAGTPEVTVPWASLAGLVDPMGPAGHLVG